MPKDLIDIAPRDYSALRIEYLFPRQLADSFLSLHVLRHTVRSQNSRQAWNYVKHSFRY